ncbi:MAG: ATP-dependent dethiobiotin synthetase BioD [Leptolyngbya sp. RL_3_1]|nr:ATP-dependent dethiobiotin synthetase BioD [Leptolyngbya sp. RL_3_1]
MGATTATPIANGLLITGTDTDVGKTVLTSALVAHWQRHHAPSSIGLMKPVQSGMGDRELYTDLFDLGQTPEQITPLQFEAPLAPPIAADREGRTIDLGPVWTRLAALLDQRQWVLVEALGGLGSPVTHEWTVADWAAAWHLPIVLVVPIKLGAIGQAVANVALARQHGLCVRGIVLNCVSPAAMDRQPDWAPMPLITALTQIPVLGILPWLADPRDRAQLVGAAAGLELACLWPQTQVVY